MKKTMGYKISISFLCIVVFAFLLLFFLRQTILNGYVHKKVDAIEKRFNLQIGFSHLEIKGIFGVSVRDISVVPLDRDTLLLVHRFEVKINPFRALLGDVDVTALRADRLHIRFVKKDSLSNFDFLYQQKQSANFPQENPVGYAQRAQKLLNMAFHLLPSNADLSQFCISYCHDDYNLAVKMSHFTINDNHFTTRIESDESGNCSQWMANGQLSDNKKQISCSFSAHNNKKVTIPFLEHRMGARVTFDSLKFELNNTSISKGILPLTGAAQVSGLTLFHSRLSPDDVLLDKGSVNFLVNVGQQSVELDSSTIVQFNKLSLNPYLRVEKDREEWHLTAKLNKQHFAADDFFSSLPRGLFYNLEGIKTSGNLSYHFLFDLNMNNIDSLVFQSQLRSEKFKILKYGNTVLSKMNGTFSYTAYDRDIPIRTFEVGEANPNFRTLDQISPLLQMAVLQSEDGDFYGHQGFRMDCLTEALVADVKARRFVRGGSTISMQLVKNVFLNRNKNIVRKLEEALIVWLVESNRLTSKSRMYEVYMNIIEWGPRVYGANEAAQFYFAKDASQLNAQESIFLAALVPRPKQARWFFTDTLTLKPHLTGYYHVLAGRLSRKGLITEEEAATMQPKVTLSGVAKNLFTAPPFETDSLEITEIPIEAEIIIK